MMRHENYKSDIQLSVQLTLGGVQIDLPDHDFLLKFSTVGSRSYICSRKGDKWVNCKAVDGQLVCILNNHGLAPGVLCVEYYDYVPDADFADGSQLKVVPSMLDVELVTGAGDDATDIDVSVPIDIEGALADAQSAAERANNIAADLEEKRDADYWRGVGIESVEQTTTSTESGGENVVTVTLTDGTESTFSVYNGAQGGGGGGSVDAYTKSETDTLLAAKQDTINDLADIRSGAEAGATAYQKPSGGIPATDFASAVQTSLGKADTALQSETDPVFGASAAAGITSSDITNWNGKTSNVGTITGITMNGLSKGTSGVVDLGIVVTDEVDPTVPLWAKQSSKPSYAYSEISGTPSLATVATSGSYNDLLNKPTIPTSTSQLTNDSGYTTTSAVDTALAAKQDIRTLVTTGSALTADTYVDFGTTDTIAPTLPASPSRADEFVFTFTCVSNAPNITLPQGVALADGFDWSEADAGVQFQVSIQDNIAAYLVLTPNT